MNLPIPAIPAAFYTYEHDADTRFAFRKPTVAELDRFLAKLAKNPVSSSLAFCDNIVTEGSKAAWSTLTDAEPGVASTVANAISERMGFRSA